MRHHPLDPRFDVSYACVRDLERLAQELPWELPAMATVEVLYDRAGRVSSLVESFSLMPAEKADADVLGWFDAYLNAFYRSLKAWRRGNVLGAQLQAAESAMHLVRTLFALERRWTPYHDRLSTQLATLDGQGWASGYLETALLQLVQTGDPTLQQTLEAQVEELLVARGFALDLWDGEIDRVKAWRFRAGRFVE